MNMDLAAHFRRAPESISNVSREERVRHQLTIDSGDYSVQRDDACGNQIGGCFDQATRGRVDSSDDVLDTGECSEPVRGVGQLRPGNTREKIFRTAGET